MDDPGVQAKIQEHILFVLIYDTQFLSAEH